jgi:alpha-D-ribose 1-methylphosphonate 5-triphosphate synthase subunit PhnH
MARPGQLRRIPPFPQARLANPYVETLARMLLDQSCGFVALARDGQESAELAAQVAFLTSAACVGFERARFALITADAPGEEQVALIEALSGGSALSPERGATVIIECRRLGTDAFEDADGFAWEVTGPGVEDRHRFVSSEDAWSRARALRRDEFPCGIDLILIDERGGRVALPRTARVKEG